MDHNDCWIPDVTLHKGNVYYWARDQSLLIITLGACLCARAGYRSPSTESPGVATMYVKYQIQSHTALKFRAMRLLVSGLEYGTFFYIANSCLSSLHGCQPEDLSFKSGDHSSS